MRRSCALVALSLTALLRAPALAAQANMSLNFSAPSAVTVTANDLTAGFVYVGAANVSVTSCTMPNNGGGPRCAVRMTPGTISGPTLTYRVVTTDLALIPATATDCGSTGLQSNTTVDVIPLFTGSVSVANPVQVRVVFCRLVTWATAPTTLTAPQLTFTVINNSNP